MPLFVVDGPAIIGVHEAQVPQFGSLVKIRHAGRRDLKDELGERIDPAEKRNQRLELGKVFDVTRMSTIQDGFHEFLGGLFVGDVGLCPTGILLRLSDGFQHVFNHPTAERRPSRFGS